MFVNDSHGPKEVAHVPADLNLMYTAICEISQTKAGWIGNKERNKATMKSAGECSSFALLNCRT